MTIATQILKLLVQAASLVVLSRLIDPAVFGLVAILSAIVIFGELFRDFGLTAAAIHAKALTQPEASNLFWANVAIGLALAASLAGSGTLLATLFGEPELARIAPVMALTFVLMGAQAQYQVRLVRDLRFSTLAVTDVVSQTIGSVLAITVAFAGWGVWALVAQTVVAQLALLASRVAIARWRPSLPRRGVKLRAFYRYGGNLVGASLLSYLSSNIDTLLIGYRFGTDALGFYNRAFQLMTLPVRQGLSPLTNVFFPLLARVRDEGERFVYMALRLQFILGASAALLFSVSIAAAPELVPLVLGENWAPSVPLFQLLGIGGVFQVFSHVSYWIFLSKGITGALLRYNLVTKLGTILLVIAASFVSVEAVAFAYSIALAVSWPINLAWLKRTAGMPFLPFFYNGAIIVLSSGAVGLLLWNVSAWWGGGVLWAAWFVAGGALFFGLLLVPPSTRAMLAEFLLRFR